ncbi:MAG: phospholipase D-like domain-containing protein [Terriglobia bacterium]
MPQDTVPEVIFSRSSKVSACIEKQVRELENSLDLAIYRFNHRGLYRVLDEAAERGIQVRLVIDRNKYRESGSIRELLARPSFAVRLSYGHLGPGSKMHHKFAVLDRKAVLTGSYNWTSESEDENFENLVLLRDARQAELYLEEFEALWSGAKVIEEK